MRYTPFLIITLLLNCFFIFSSQAQGTPRDSIHTLKAVVVKAHLTEQPKLRLTSSVGIADSIQLNANLGSTLLPALNSIPGLRMEERSPGSYRLSIRGSLLRSPFGVRNVKIYFDEMPLTDAGGNTYLNSIDAGSMDNINILKGPDGSLFGANSGGVVLINPKGTGIQKNELSFSLSRGSFASNHQQFSASFQPSQTYGFSIHQSFQDAEGYRENSAMKHNFIQTVQRWNYNPNSELRFTSFYSDLNYQTPGGLTESQYNQNPKLARQAAGPIPGAVEQEAGIYNKTLFGGLVHSVQISQKLKHVATVFGTHTDFTNPFITNYEIRDENNGGFRTYFNYNSLVKSSFNWNLDLGMEIQSGSSSINNYDNNQGVRGAEQASDNLRYGQHFYFSRFSATLQDNFFIEASASLNYNKFHFKERFPTKETDYSKLSFNPEWMPRLAFSYLITPKTSWRGSASRGYSPPTVAEVRSSDNTINTDLEAETGWNYETGFRVEKSNFNLDFSVFNYRMKNGIVRQLRKNGAEYFNNAGEINQVGFEAATHISVIRNPSNEFIKSLQINSNLTLSKFRFVDYQIKNEDFSTNKLTGVPSTVLVSSLLAKLPYSLGLYVQHNYTSSIPLNDKNSVFADSYHLMQAKIYWNKKIVNTTNLQLFAGVDNLLNEKYSLGNDINAFGNRFFNAAATRNYFIGMSIKI